LNQIANPFVSLDLLAESGVDLPQCLLLGRLAVAVDIQSDEAEVDGEPHRVVLDQRERRLGLREVTDEFLEHRSKVLVRDRLRLRVRRDRQPRERDHSAGAVGLQSVLEEPLDKVFDRANKLDRAEAKPGLAVLGMGPPYASCSSGDRSCHINAGLLARTGRIGGLIH